jgi:hypothetical protein
MYFKQYHSILILVYRNIKYALIQTSFSPAIYILVICKSKVGFGCNSQYINDTLQF